MPNIIEIGDLYRYRHSSAQPEFLLILYVDPTFIEVLSLWNGKFGRCRLSAETILKDNQMPDDWELTKPHD